MSCAKINWKHCLPSYKKKKKKAPSPQTLFISKPYFVLKMD